MRELATIVIPVWENYWSAEDLSLLQQAIYTLKGFSFVFVSGENQYQEQVQQLFPESTFYRFDPKYFSGQKAFAQLTLHEEFYEQFGWAEYMLLLLGNTIFVKNELHYWCKQGHDYVSDKNGWCSLRKIDRFVTLTKKNRRGIHKFLSGSVAFENDHVYWHKKSKGLWPALNVPTEIVSRYFSLPFDQVNWELKRIDLPFTITGIDPNSHAEKLELLLKHK